MVARFRLFDLAWVPEVTCLPMAASEVMWIVDRNIDLIKIYPSNALDRTDTGKIIWIRCYQNTLIESREPGSQCQTCLASIAVTTMTLGNPKPNMTGRQPDMLGIAYSEIHMSHVYSI